MQKSPIDIYLAKVAAGDKSVLPKLCQQLADRLVYVPLTTPVSSSEGTTKVKILRFNEDGKFKVPFFTSEKKFKNWCFTIGHGDSSFSLLGGDLCAGLEENTWLIVDPSDPNSIELGPDQVKHISESGMLEVAKSESAPEPIAQPVTVAPVALAIEIPADKPTNYPSQAPKSEAEDTIVHEAAVGAGIVASNSRAEMPEMGSNKTPGLLSGRAGVRSPSSTNLNRTIILSGEAEAMAKQALEAQQAEKAPKKKRSFLSFLKSGKM